MRRLLFILSCSALLAACVTTPPAPPPSTDWQQRMGDLQKAAAWQLDGRAAVAVGTQGWQATLNWQQQGESSEVHLAGPSAWARWY